MSRALKEAEKNYSVIQQECLVIVFVMKLFHHYLLGRPFTILTDHASLQWLSGQKMEGLLCRWALALQEYDFIIRYRKGSQNSNADALSRCHPQTEKWAAVASGKDRKLLKLAQANDLVLKEFLLALRTPVKRPVQWKQQLLARILNYGHKMW